MNAIPLLPLAFTLVEIAVAVVIIAIAATLLFRIFVGAKDKLEQSQKITYTSGWVNPPATIPAAPGAGTFTYKVERQKGSQPKEAAPDRPVQFTFNPSPAGSGVLVSVGQSGTPFAIPSTTPPTLAFPGLSDSYGIIQVVVQLEAGTSGTLVASDPKTAASDPPIGFKAQ